MKTYECSVCGAPCAPASFPSHDLRIVARDADDTIFCQVCAADIDRRTLADTGSVGAYLSGDGRQITTWAGETLARVTRSRSDRRLTYWQARTPDGVHLYGRSRGPGMYTTARTYKA